MKAALLLVAVVGAWLALAGGRPGDPGDSVVSRYPSGQVKSECAYEDGERHGAARTFHPDGTPRSAGRYERGLEEGPWSWWRADGSPDPERSGVYRGGRRVAPLADAS